MINYALTIDSVNYAFEIGANFTLDASENYDNGQLVIKNTTKSTPFTESDDVVLTIGTTSYYFIVQADKMEQITSTLYDHTITVLEHTAKLTKIYSPNRYFTVDSSGDLWTAYDMLNRIRLTSPFLKSQQFTISSATQTALNVDIAQKKFETKNLWEISRSILNTIDAIPRLTSTGLLTHTKIDELNNAITLSNLIASQKEIDFNNYASHVISDINNLVYEGKFSGGSPIGAVVYPSDTSATTFRVLEGKYADADAVIIVDKNIRQIHSFRVYGVQVLENPIGTYISVNLTPYLVSKERWDGLPIGSRTESTLYGQVAQKNTLWFNENTNIIEGFGEQIDTLASLVNPTRLELAIRSALATYTSYTYQSQTIKDYSFQVKYEPYIPGNISVVKQDNAVSKYSEILNSPKDSIIDLERYGGILNSLVNRLSNGNYLLKRRQTSASDLFELNDYTSDGYKIIKATHELYPSEIISTYELGKNIINIDGYQTVDRTTDPYTIGRDNVNANFRYTEYIELSTTSRTTTGSITTLGWTKFFGTFTLSISNSQVLLAQYYSADSNQSTSAINTTVTSSGKNGLRFLTGFNHPIFVGNQFGNDGYDDIMNPIRYTDESGFMTSCAWYLINSATIDKDDHPLSSYESNTLFEIGLENYYKNPNEILTFNYEILFVADDDIIIGDYLSTENSLVQDISSVLTMTVYVASATTKYTLFDKVVKDTVSSSTTFTIDSTNRYIDVSGVSGTGTATWAIGDSLGNLYFAVNYNGSSRQRIYFNNLVARTTEESL